MAYHPTRLACLAELAAEGELDINQLRNLTGLRASSIHASLDQARFEGLVKQDGRRESPGRGGGPTIWKITDRGRQWLANHRKPA